jgi:hypothetical protein
VGKPSTKASREEDSKDAGSWAAGEQVSQGVAGKTLPQWLSHVVSVSNKSGAVGDFLAAVSGKPLTKAQYARMAKIYKEYPLGIEDLMSVICYVAIKDTKGDQLDYLQKIVDKKRGLKREGNSERGFSRDEYVES